MKTTRNENGVMEYNDSHKRYMKAKAMRDWIRKIYDDQQYADLRKFDWEISRMDDDELCSQDNMMKMHGWLIRIQIGHGWGDLGKFLDTLVTY